MPVSLTTLETIIREAGDLALRQFNDLQNLEVSQKSPRDFVTAADIAVEGISPSAVWRYLISRYEGKYGIGRYLLFTHIDVRSNGPARW